MYERETWIADTTSCTHNLPLESWVDQQRARMKSTESNLEQLNPFRLWDWVREHAQATEEWSEILCTLVETTFDLVQRNPAKVR